MGILQLFIIIVIWMVARNFSRMLKQAPNVRRAASTLRQQLEKQVNERAGVPTSLDKPGASPQQMDRQSTMTIDGEKPAWESWVPLVEEPREKRYETFVSGEFEVAAPRRTPVPRRGTSAAPADKQKPLLPQLGGDVLVQAVVFSEVLGPPKARRSAGRPMARNQQR